MLVQVITWASVDQDPCHHMASFGHNGVNTLRPRHIGHVTDDIFKFIFLNKSCCIQNSLNGQVSIVWGNGLAQNRWQAVIWTNDALTQWCICVSLGLDELIHFGPRGGLSKRYCLTSIGIPMLKMRRSHDHLLFNMGIPIGSLFWDRSQIIYFIFPHSYVEYSLM